ncbi:replication protein A 14 kDa subunit [Ramazzottius varieornatus]|uniref:Replication protein A 14 kDa subunit n=1 Tax=Ramazzottius varieornatus TaxID=947166 RepID=A0A1D1VF82_RAMVA|nr:replication protein A 14 kDa subunit [Ramazzottius varieornatus]
MMQKGDAGAAGNVPTRRVNATMLPTMQGKYVCMLGIVENVEGNGRSFRLQSPDKKSVIIRMKEPLGEPIDGLIEVEGFVTGQNAIDCHMYTLCGANNGINFSLDTYNEAIQIASNHPDVYITTV